MRAWREVVQKMVYEAALVEDVERWGDERTPFEYRWEHVQTTVRLALRLAECTGADREVCEAAAWLHDVTKTYSWEHKTNHGVDGAARAREILAQVETLAENQYVDPFYPAIALTALGEYDRAIVKLRECVEIGSTSISFLKDGRWLDPLRSDPRFEELAEEVFGG